MNILYTTHCTRCEALKEKLKNANINFVEVDDEEVMQEKGFDLMPVFQYGDIEMSFSTAINWLKTMENKYENRN